MVNWTDPYAVRDGAWLKGNLHAHTAPASPCGSMPVETVVNAYVQAGYDFLSISDHKVLTEADDPRIVMIPGVEWNSPTGEHTGIYTEDTALLEESIALEDHEKLLARLADTSALVILNHPNWALVPHYSREDLAAKHHYEGVEVFNVVITRLAGNAEAADKWDYLLATGRRVLGFVGEDAHVEEDIGNAWLGVRAAERSPSGILSALRQGNFYGSSGVVITDIRREGDTVTVETENAQELQVIADAGLVLERQTGTSCRTDLSKPALSYVTPTYVRIEAFGPGSAKAWTQPFFLE